MPQPQSGPQLAVSPEPHVQLLAGAVSAGLVAAAVAQPQEQDPVVAEVSVMSVVVKVLSPPLPSSS